MYLQPNILPEKYYLVVCIPSAQYFDLTRYEFANSVDNLCNIIKMMYEKCYNIIDVRGFWILVRVEHMSLISARKYDKK